LNTALDTNGKETYKVYLPPDVGRALRDAKAATRLSHSDIVTEALRVHLLTQATPPRDGKPDERKAG
jgi:hypothetical protein